MKEQEEPGRSIHVDLTAGKVPMDAPEGAQVVGGDWLALAFLANHLTNDGLPVDISDDRNIGLGFGMARCRARVDESYDGSSPVVPIWYDLRLPSLGITISESLAGPAAEKTPEASVQSLQGAAHMFAVGTLDPIRHLFGAARPADQVAVGEIQVTSGGRRSDWELFVGQPIVVGPGKVSLRVDTQRVPVEENCLFQALFPALVPTLQHERVHWCKVVAWGNPANMPAGGQVTIDNAPTSANGSSLDSLEVEGGPATVRQFVIMRPLSHRRAAGSAVERDSIFAECVFPATKTRISVLTKLDSDRRGGIKWRALPWNRARE